MEVTASSVEEVKITGNAQTNLSGVGLAALDYVNASESGGGVTIDASSSAVILRLIGSQQDDTLTAGDAAQTLTARNTLIGNGGDDMLMAGTGGGALVGGAGADEMTGNTGTDLFVINAASESQVTFKEEEDGSYTAQGYDTFNSFAAGTDKLHLSKALETIAKAGSVKGVTEWGGGPAGGALNALVGSGWKAVDNDGTPGGTSTATIRIDGDGTGRTTATGSNDNSTPDGGATNLHEFIGDGKGLFLTTVVGPVGDFGATTRTVKNSIALIAQDSDQGDDAIGTADTGDGLWLLVDIDGDGDFDAATDMVIFISGAIDDNGFVATTDISS